MRSYGIFRITFVLFTLFTLTLFGVRWLGSTQPLLSAPLWGVLLSNADGSPCQRPCMFGIQPGVTHFGHAIDLLKSHPFIANMIAKDPSVDEKNDGHNFLLGTKYFGFISLGADKDKTVFGLGFGDFDVYHVSLGEIISKFGAPERIETHASGTGNTDIMGILLDYPTQGLQFFLIYHYDDFIKPESIIGVAEVDSPDYFTQCRLYYHCQNWQGFKAIQRYSQSVPIYQP